jgi:tRNA uridine 5-carboxymethylaminomethyl modification enzyme
MQRNQLEVDRKETDHMTNDQKASANSTTVDICVVGAGHAGCEAALACARLGLQTVLFTISIENIALMPCNPNIGGTSKGHLVREIDALGGEMGKNIDRTFIQSKMLNLSKGPAVHSLRAQADKSEYSRSMRKVLENQDNLRIKQSEVTKLLWEETSDKRKRVIGLQTITGMEYRASAVILCTGTYLRARCLCGETITYTGPNGLKAANDLTDSLQELGISLYRFKTGTPARMDRRSIDFSKTIEQFGDERVVPFSFSTDPDTIQKEQVSCYLTFTNEETHEIIRRNLHRSPIYAGIIEGTGPRYCPSIEDKVVKFSDKSRHQVFLEPEGIHTNEVYVAGMSSSLPEDVQQSMYRTIAGLENCQIVRNAYAIEYDCIDARQLRPNLEFQMIDALFSGGQFNGSSGYEEAAAQGLLAGINAAMSVLHKEPLIINRAQGYIGVLIDDLVTKENREPYRMMTSRAEYRLLLRQDNADLRLRELGYLVGLISQEQMDSLKKKEDAIHQEMQRLKETIIPGNKQVNAFLEQKDSAPLKSAASLADLLCRPELSYETLAPLDTNRPTLSLDVIEQVAIELKYEGYIDRQKKQVAQFLKMENRIIPQNLDYDVVPSLRIEARQKLKEYKPYSIGQASRISGVSPADISVLLVYLKAKSEESSRDRRSDDAL